MNTQPDPIDRLTKTAVTRGYREGLLRAAEIIAANHRHGGFELIRLIKLEVSVDDPEIFEKIMAAAK